MFDKSRVDAVFEVKECAFDAVKLRVRLARELERAGVHVALETEALRLADEGSSSYKSASMALTIRHGGEDEPSHATACSTARSRD